MQYVELIALADLVMFNNPPDIFSNCIKYDCDSQSLHVR